jgi:hypothetical protein
LAHLPQVRIKTARCPPSLTYTSRLVLRAAASSTSDIVIIFIPANSFHQKVLGPRFVSFQFSYRKTTKTLLFTTSAGEIITNT